MEPGKKFTGPRIAKNKQDALEHHLSESGEVAAMIIHALEQAEIALTYYAQLRGELLSGRHALKLIREVREKL